jgi:transcription-repair coupling factor (superfamily II helicase)
LLHIGHLRAECARLGIKEAVVVRSHMGDYTARLSPIELKTSQRVRLQRIVPKAIYKEDIGQLVIPVPRRSDPTGELAALLAELAPPVASPVP